MDNDTKNTKLYSIEKSSSNTNLQQFYSIPLDDTYTSSCNRNYSEKNIITNPISIAQNNVKVLIEPKMRLYSNIKNDSTTDEDDNLNLSSPNITELIENKQEQLKDINKQQFYQQSVLNSVQMIDDQQPTNEKSNKKGSICDMFCANLYSFFRFNKNKHELNEKTSILNNTNNNNTLSDNCNKQISSNCKNTIISKSNNEASSINKYTSNTSFNSFDESRLYDTSNNKNDISINTLMNQSLSISLPASNYQAPVQSRRKIVPLSIAISSTSSSLHGDNDNTNLSTSKLSLNSETRILYSNTNTYSNYYGINQQQNLHSKECQKENIYNFNIDSNNIASNSKDTIDEAIRNLGVNLSEISTNFDSFSIEINSSNELSPIASSSEKLNSIEKQQEEAQIEDKNQDNDANPV